MPLIALIEGNHPQDFIYGMQLPPPSPRSHKKPCTNRAQNSDDCRILQRIPRMAPAMANIDSDQ